jgi:hypothetical protein
MQADVDRARERRYPGRVIGELTPGRIRIARIVAFAADAVQLGALPFFVGGAASPWNDALDVAVAAAMVGLLGWHWSFLPTLVAESVPFLDLVPTWTAAVFLATRGARPVVTSEAGPTPTREAAARDAAPRALPPAAR